MKKQEKKKYNDLASAALFGRVPRGDDDEAGKDDGREIRRANASCLSSSRFHRSREISRPLPPQPPPSSPSRCTRPSPGLHGATSVTSAAAFAPPPKRASRAEWTMSGLVVETAPRRCNHLTRAPIARQATRRNLESLNATRVTASNASACPVVIRSGGERKDPGIGDCSMCEIVRRYAKDSRRKDVKS